MSTVTRTLGGLCVDWEKRIQAAKGERDGLQSQLDLHRERLREMGKEPNPNLAQIAALKARIAVLEAQVAELTLAINTEEADFQFVCHGPGPPS